MTVWSAALLDWYRGHARDLPWRGETDPYRVLVSEAMLQQTQAARVSARYPVFLAAFPTAEDLAAAPLAAVLAAWSGLGYNTRARRLRDAARVVVEQGWPTSVDGLLDLPGVGPYTAAAVACFAFGVQVAAPDTNARRVLSRRRGRPLDGAELAAVAAEELSGDARDWNQAIMDFGATLCLPRTPRCAECPIATGCAGPDTYTPPRPQGRFEGSDRQVRSTLLRELLHAPMGAETLAERTGFAEDRVSAALAALAADELVEQADTLWAVAAG